MSAIAMLERMAGRPLSSSEVYTGTVSPHGTYNYGTVLQAPAVYNMTHRYGFNTAGRTTGQGTHIGGAFGGLFANVLIYAGLFWLLQRWLSRPVQQSLPANWATLRTLNPNAFAAALGAMLGVFSTVTAQWVYRPMAQVPPPVVVIPQTPPAMPQQQRPPVQAVQQQPQQQQQQQQPGTGSGPSQSGWWQWS